MEISSKSQAENGTDNNTIMTPLRVRQSIAANTGGGTASDYSSLVNKPQINSITLDGNKTGTQLGLASSSDIPTKTSDLTNDSNFAVTNANNNFSATQRVNGTVYSQSSYIEKGGGLGLRATGPVPGPVTNETGAITFYQWMEEEPDIYTEITKAKINVANVLDLTNCNPYYTAYDENGNQLVSSQLALMSNVPTKMSDLSNDTGYITGMTILTYGSSTWQNFLDAYNANRVVYCKASSGSNPGSGSKTRRAFLAYVNNETNPTEVEFQYYRSVSSHSMAQQGDQVFVYKLTNRGVWSVTTREASSKVVAGTGLSSTYSGGTLTLSTASNNAVKDADNNFSAQQTFNTPQDQYSTIKIKPSNKGESSIAYYDINGNSQFVAGFNTSNSDKWSIYSETTYMNVFSVDRYGNLQIPGGLTANGTNDLKNTMYGFIYTDKTIPSGSYTEIDNLSSYFNTTDGRLSISNGKIKIGAGISLIKVSFNIGLNIANQDTLYSYLTKNGSSTGLWLVKYVQGAYDSVYRQDYVEVVENDEISCSVFLGNGGTVASSGRTNFTVEIIK